GRGEAMPTIRIDDDVWRALKSRAEPFEDTPNDVLRRVFHLDEKDAYGNLPSNERAPSIARKRRSGARPGAYIPDRDYTGHQVTGYQLEGVTYPAASFRDILLSLCNDLRRKYGRTFDEAALNLHGKKGVYFSTTPDLRQPQKLLGEGLFVETNLNANLLVGICRALVKGLGEDPNKLHINTISKAPMETMKSSRRSA
ncbi:MAG: hypothetical protein ACRD2L_09740, partial [Terriglobia bacterium]